ncbi:AraC family transcriptional regulator [Chitinophagaceae bacterium MMS25-I14]
MLSDQTFRLDNYSQFYFTDGNQYADEYPISKGLSIIRTADHFRKCRRAVEPHMMDTYMLCLILDGEGIYNFNADTYYLKKNTICFIPPWTLTSWQSQTARQNGFCCTFTDPFFNQGRENKKWLREIALGGHSAFTLTEQQTNYFAALLEDMFNEVIQKSTDSEEIIQIQLQLIMKKVAGLFPMKHHFIAPKTKAAITLTRSFVQNCKEDFELLFKGEIETLPSLSTYADRLYVTPNHLNDTVKDVIGKSVGQYLYQELTHHANSLLLQTDWNVSRIANQLGFKDASYFSRFYKKQTKCTPSAYREKIRR